MCTDYMTRHYDTNTHHIIYIIYTYIIYIYIFIYNIYIYLYIDYIYIRLYCLYYIFCIGPVQVGCPSFPGENWLLVA